MSCMPDPEVETYQYVMKSVRDNGSHALTELAGQSRHELTDRIHHQRMRIALLRKDPPGQPHPWTNTYAEHKKYIEALEGHVSGLDHNIEVLNQALVASEMRCRGHTARVIGARALADP